MQACNNGNSSASSSRPPPTADTSGDGVQWPSTAEVVNPTVPPDRESDGSYVEEDSSDDDSENEEEMSLESIREDEVIDAQYFAKLDTHDDAAKVFSNTELEDLKRRELALMERNEKGYYRSKLEHAKLYSEISAAYQPYIEAEMLNMLRHPWSTQSNEAMNQSVAAYAPKGKTYSLTNSLDTRVSIAGSIQIVGYYSFWDQVFHKLNIDMDPNLRKHLQSRDIIKKKKSKQQKTKEGKKLRGEKKYEKLNKATEDWQEQQRTGEGYQSGIAVAMALAKKNLPDPAERNPEGTPKAQWRCIYYPKYCSNLGHKDARSKECGMKTKSKEERDAAKKCILAEAVEQEMRENPQNSTYRKVYLFFNYFSVY